MSRDRFSGTPRVFLSYARKDGDLERRVANAMDMYRQGLHHDGDGTTISLDAVVLTGDNFEDQQFKDAVKEQFQEAFAEVPRTATFCFRRASAWCSKATCAPRRAIDIYSRPGGSGRSRHAESSKLG